MKDPTTMTSNQKNAYIFHTQRRGAMFPGGRFHWIYCLIGDIQTFLDGIEHYIHYKENFPDRGGGNLSVPSLISTAIEFISALYFGGTKYMEELGRCKKHDATKNVQQFVTKFFPENYKKLPLLIWDGIRNGIVHIFSPKPFEYQGEIIRFQFFVEPKTCPSYATKEGNTVFIGINAFELFEVLKKALEDYRHELETNEELKDKFILAWESIEDYARPIKPNSGLSREAEALLSEIDASNGYLILWKGRPSGDITGSLETKRQPEGGPEIRLDSTANVSPFFFDEGGGIKGVR